MQGRGGRHRRGDRRRRRRGACMEGDGSLAHYASLADCPAGSWVQVSAIAGHVGYAPRLRELGVLEGAAIYIIKRSDPLLILVGDTRLAIDMGTAAGIEVNGECQP